jgi:hypothetical protein
MPRWCTLTTAINHTGLYHCQILDELRAYWWHKNLLKCYNASAFGYPTSPQQLIRIVNTTRKWDTDTTYFASTCSSHVIMSKTYRTYAILTPENPMSFLQIYCVMHGNPWEQSMYLLFLMGSAPHNLFLHKVLEQTKNECCCVSMGSIMFVSAPDSTVQSHAQTAAWLLPISTTSNA